MLFIQFSSKVFALSRCVRVVITEVTVLCGVYFHVFPQALPWLSLHQLWIVVSAFLSGCYYYSTLVLDLASVAFPRIRVSKLSMFLR